MPGRAQVGATLEAQKNAATFLKHAPDGYVKHQKVSKRPKASASKVRILRAGPDGSAFFISIR